MTTFLDNLILWGTNPVYPIVLGSLLYLWATVGFFYRGQPFMALVWFNYASANIFMALHTLRGEGSGQRMH